ncbi:MAG TPA: Asp23/Gls24 family envelope stress response protein [Chloroflexota bacterium]|nr:Asp23/Gls24 family envelope stress response protein [Chloroflexota bacterium]
MPAGKQMPESDKLGKIEVSPRAIASIAADAVLRSYGVVGMAAARLQDGLAEVLRREHQERGVMVHLIDGQITIDLFVVVEYGTRVSEVGRNIAQSVKFAVEKAIGMPVARVNVNVQGLRISDRS